MAETVVSQGKADMVGMTRAHIADPDIVTKILDGQADDIRPCVGANVCIAQALSGKPVRCFHNHMAVREYELGELSRQTRRKGLPSSAAGRLVWKLQE